MPENQDIAIHGTIDCAKSPLDPALLAPALSEVIKTDAGRALIEAIGGYLMWVSRDSVLAAIEVSVARTRDRAPDPHVDVLLRRLGDETRLLSDAIGRVLGPTHSDAKH